jgi:hypothetical protein
MWISAGQCPVSCFLFIVLFSMGHESLLHKIKGPLWKKFSNSRFEEKPDKR